MMNQRESWHCAGEGRRWRHGPRLSRRAASPRAPTPRKHSLGEGEGALNLVAWTGYVASGTAASRSRATTGSRRSRTETGCKVNGQGRGLDSGTWRPADEDRRIRRRFASGDATLR